MINCIRSKLKPDTPTTIYISNNKVPENPEERKELIREAHELCVKGHMWIQKTLEKLRTKYNWNGITKEVEQYVKNCKTCQFENQKYERIKTNPGLPDIPMRPNVKVSLDTMGPLPSSNGFKYILVIQDYLTRYLTAAPIKTKTSKETLKAFWNNYVAIFGLLKEILTDNGVEFAGEFYSQLKKFGVKFSSKAVYHPQSNGKNERSHKEILNYVRSYINENNA